MDELRVEIWDFLYRGSAPKSVEEIAQNVDRDLDTVRMAVDHHWFDVVDDTVAIAKNGS